jgi:hypothetical protein
MAMMMDQITHTDDLNLMSFQELDSQLSIFESSQVGRDSSTPGLSISNLGEHIDMSMQQSHTIIVDSNEIYSPRPHYDNTRTKLKNQSFGKLIQYVFVVAIFNTSHKLNKKL